LKNPGLIRDRGVGDQEEAVSFVAPYRSTRGVSLLEGGFVALSLATWSLAV